MTLAAGPFAIAAVLLVAGGAFKAASPGDTANALRAVGIPAPPMLVRIGGVLEVVIGSFALATGSRVSAALVAISYLAFAGFVMLAFRRDAPIATCGCFGKADTPPSTVHVVINVLAATAALVVVFDPGAGIPDVVASQPLAGVPYLMLVATGAALAFVALTRLPVLLALVRTGEQE